MSNCSGKTGGQDWYKLLNSNTVREEEFGGAEGSRTPDPHNAIVVLYQLSYDPTQMCDLYEAGVRACQSQNPIILKSLSPTLTW